MGKEEEYEEPKIIGTAPYAGECSEGTVGSFVY